MCFRSGGFQARRLLQFRPSLAATGLQWSAIATAGPLSVVTNVFTPAQPTNTAFFYRIRIE
jgi:hypothetical protein